MTDGFAFDRWLVGDGSEIVLHTESGEFTRGLIRWRIATLLEAVRVGVADRTGLVAVVGPNDDRTLCASVASQLAGRLTTVVDPRSAGEANRVLASSDTAAVLAVGGSALKVPSSAVSLDVDALIDAADGEWSDTKQDDRPESSLSDGLAPGTGDCLVLFSSGSTGTPKGIVRSHESMLRTWSAGELRALQDDPCIALAGPLGYVSSQVIVHQAWRSGVPIALFDGMSSGLMGLVAFMTRAGVTMLSSQVAPYRSMLELPGFGEVGLRWLSLWGEPLFDRDFERHRIVQPQCHLMFGYGSTETMVAGCQDVAPGAMPERNARFHPFADVVLAVEEGQGTGDGGSSGELLVHNPWLATGYRGDDEKTAATFVEREGRRWARTGDRVTLYDDGTFELHGRVDDRLKVLGHNVEPAAVEAVLTSLPGIADAAVVGAERPGGGIRLAAFIVRSDWSRQDVSELRRTVRAALSAASVPATWTVVDELARLATGKVDRPRLARQAGEFRYAVNPEERPTNDIERSVLRHACDLLGLDELGIDDDLSDLGLDSLMLADLQARLEEVFTVPPTLNSMAQAPTVRAISRAEVTGSTLVPLIDDSTSGLGAAGGACPLVLVVPGAGASVLYLRPLARRLGGFSKVRAVPAADFVSISRLVKATVTALLDDRSLSRERGVVFVGHSLGGLTAIELARGAMDAGVRVNGVVLLDTAAPPPRFSVQRVKTALRPRSRWAAFRAARALRTSPANHSDRARFSLEADRRATDQVGDANRRRWRPLACPGRLIVAESSHVADPAQWRRFFPVGFSVSTVSVGHNAMVTEPSVADVAEAVKSAIAGWN